MKPLSALLMKDALIALDEILPKTIKLIIGGGGAMVLAHDFPLVTTDIDAIPVGMEVSELDPLVKQVAGKLELPPDWLNPYFATFSHVLPKDYGTRLVGVYAGKHLEAMALSKTDLLIMKCFAHRQKDIGHAKALIRGGAEFKKVESHLDFLQEKGIPGSQSALDFLDDLL